jgi:hypothetical protein
MKKTIILSTKTLMSMYKGSGGFHLDVNTKITHLCNTCTLHNPANQKKADEVCVCVCVPYWAPFLTPGMLSLQLYNFIKQECLRLIGTRNQMYGKIKRLKQTEYVQETANDSFTGEEVTAAFAKHEQPSKHHACIACTGLFFLSALQDCHS